MKTNTFGIILMAVGILMVVYTGFHYVTTENVVDLGPIEINKEKNHFVRWSPFIGIALLIGGIVLMFLNKKSSK